MLVGRESHATALTVYNANRSGGRCRTRVSDKIANTGGWRKQFLGLHQKLGVRRHDLYQHLGDELRALLEISSEMEERPSVVYGRVASWIDQMICNVKPGPQTSSNVFLSLRVSYNIDVDDPDFCVLDALEKKSMAELDLSQRRKRLAKDEYGKVADSTSRKYVTDFQKQFLPIIEAQLIEARIIPSTDKTAELAEESPLLDSDVEDQADEVTPQLSQEEVVTET